MENGEKGRLQLVNWHLITSCKYTITRSRLFKKSFDTAIVERIFFSKCLFIIQRDFIKPQLPDRDEFQCHTSWSYIVLLIWISKRYRPWRRGEIRVVIFLYFVFLFFCHYNCIRLIPCNSCNVKGRNGFGI